MWGKAGSIINSGHEIYPWSEIIEIIILKPQDVARVQRDSGMLKMSVSSRFGFWIWKSSHMSAAVRPTVYTNPSPEM